MDDSDKDSQSFIAFAEGTTTGLPVALANGPHREGSDIADEVPTQPARGKHVSVEDTGSPENARPEPKTRCREM
ncbi:hypothetical protein O0R43_27270 [Rhodococcus sp. A5(2022)]|nr:hypothetical protein [Rhodococcus sp. A5(2022)]MCZ1075606.1 hypothetical protein [Rhodococcus sp. A5(2022)]